MTTCVFSYYNLASGGSIANAGGASFETSAPLSNLLTPRLGQMAIQVGLPANAYFDVFIRGGSPTYSAMVGVIAILNHNIIVMEDQTDLDIQVTFSDGTTSSSLGELNPDNFLNISNADGTFQSHIIWVPTDPAFLTKRVESVRFFIGNLGYTVTGQIDPYTGQITSSPLSLGGIWIGPKFTPANGISIDGFAQSVADNSQVVRSIGGQVWAEPEVRQRTMKATFAGLLESEVYALAPTQCLQQLAAYCGSSRPLIAVPTTSTDMLMYTQAIYGYLSAPAAWNLVEKVDDNNVKTRLYSGGLEIVEAR